MGQEVNERLVVSNESKRLERQHDSGWIASHVEPAGNLQKGVYNLHQAQAAKTNDPQATYAGTVVHANERHVYQDHGEKGITRHNRHAFPEPPEIGRYTKIHYVAGHAQTDQKPRAEDRQKANDFRTMTPKEAIQKHPELVDAYGVVKAAEVVAKEKFVQPGEQQKFVDLLRDNLAQRIEQGHKMPQVKLREEQQENELDRGR